MQILIQLYNMPLITFQYQCHFIRSIFALDSKATAYQNQMVLGCLL